MVLESQGIRDKIVTAALPEVRQQGWGLSVLRQAASASGYQDDMVEAVFPGGLSDAVAHFADMIDREMLQKLSPVAVSSLRVRDRVRCAVLTRFSLLTAHREEVRKTLAYWALPTHVLQGQRVLWRTADRIWNWAGDTATDYNRHTKRALLSSVLLGTAMVWVNDESEGEIVTQDFLDRRLENVVAFGQAIGTMKSVLPTLIRKRLKP